ncbi:hypothetical protein ACT7DG_23670 [Bacillus cereus]
MQRLYEVLKPLGDSKPDWWILQKSSSCAWRGLEL